MSTLANTLELRAFVLFEILDSFYPDPFFREKMPPQMISVITFLSVHQYGSFAQHILLLAFGPAKKYVPFCIYSAFAYFP